MYGVNIRSTGYYLIIAPLTEYGVESGPTPAEARPIHIPISQTRQLSGVIFASGNFRLRPHCVPCSVWQPVSAVGTAKRCRDGRSPNVVGRVASPPREPLGARHAALSEHSETSQKAGPAGRGVIRGLRAP